jgi:phenylalanyl-tRNA synthetase beta chain
MKISGPWLQAYFDPPLPSAERLAEALTFHAFEIESIEGDVLDVKVTPNRGHDALSHRGIARELSAILKVPMVSDPLRQHVSLAPATEELKVTVEDSDRCPRFTAAVIKNVRVGPSPDWLREALEGVGQRSINNIVDATNYVMFDIGQPLHAFDARKLKPDGGWHLLVRAAKNGETITGLDEKAYTLNEHMLVIADGNSGNALSIAGIKGGKDSGVDASTTDIILEAANWNGPMIRKASQALKLRTDASDRFQQVISPELAAYGLAEAARLIVEIAGGEIGGYVDVYPSPQQPRTVSVSTDRINAMLGTSLTTIEVADTLARLDLPFAQSGDFFAVTPPFERLDLMLPQDLIEEVARIVGYEHIPAVELPANGPRPLINKDFYWCERVREYLVSHGFSEVYTSVFVKKGERAVLNKVESDTPFLRDSLIPGMKAAMKKNAPNLPLLGLRHLRIFEIGTVFKKNSEHVHLAIGEKQAKDGMAAKERLEALCAEFGVRADIRHDGDVAELDLGPVIAELSEPTAYEHLPVSTTEHIEPFSKYPFIVRDIAMWVPEGPEAISQALSIFGAEAGRLLRHVELFDQYKKDDRMSYAFHLVLQSYDKTLTDAEANDVMARIASAAKQRGWEVR